MFTGWLFNVYIQKHCTYPLKNVNFCCFSSLNLHMLTSCSFIINF